MIFIVPPLIGLGVGAVLAYLLTPVVVYTTAVVLAAISIILGVLTSRIDLSSDYSGDGGLAVLSATLMCVITVLTMIASTIGAAIYQFLVT